MQSTEFPQVNLTLTAGDNPNTHDIPAARCLDAHEEPCLVAKFELTEQEIEYITKTKSLWISIRGFNWPPILPTVLNPFEDLGHQIPRGLPPMLYRDETMKLLETQWRLEEYFPDDESWLDFVEYMSTRIDFVDMGLQMHALTKYKSIEDVLVLFSDIISEFKDAKVYEEFLNHDLSDSADMPNANTPRIKEQ